MKTKTTRAGAVACLSVLTFAAVQAARADQTAAAAERTYTGLIGSVNPGEHTMVMKSLFADKHFNVGDTCTYTMMNNTPGAVGDLRAGEKVKVYYMDHSGVLVADRIEQIPMQYEGQVRSIDSVNHTLTLHSRALDKDFQIANDCRVLLRNDRPGSLAEIQVGDHVTVTYEKPSGAMTARQIAQTSQVFTGSLVAIDLPERTVKAREGFETRKFNLADNCAIVVNGKADGRMDDLKPEDRLVFSYDEINGVDVVNRIGPAPENKSTVVTTAPVTGY